MTGYFLQKKGIQIKHLIIDQIASKSLNISSFIKLIFQIVFKNTLRKLGVFSSKHVKILEFYDMGLYVENVGSLNELLSNSENLKILVVSKSMLGAFGALLIATFANIFTPKLQQLG